MNQRKARRLRKQAEYSPTSEEKAKQFKFPGIQRLARSPVFETHTRTVREMGPLGKVISWQETRPIMGIDGRTPRSPKWSEQRDEAGELVMAPEFTVVPIQKPVSLVDTGRVSRKRYLQLKRKGRTTA